MEEKVIRSNPEYLSSSLARLLELISIIENSEERHVTIKISCEQTITPALALSLIVYCAGVEKMVQFTDVDSYLNEISFIDGGLKPEEYRSSTFKAVIEGFADKAYTPIINFPVSAQSDYKDTVSTLVEDLIIRQLSLRPNIATGLKYIIEETLDNVTEHSHSDRGYIFARANLGMRYLDISIADKGITLLGSYKTLHDNEIADDIEAMKAANRGISTKNLPDAENRGYGIYTSKKMIIDGLKGQYMMISGGSFYIKDNEYDNFFSLPEGNRWNGTVVSFRLFYDNPAFNYIKYIE